jgi:prepilin-type N-terminal cleavage/methylation domain-containing protein
MFNKATANQKKIQKGFTLIELLIVIGILGILAAAILVALNPLEQFARGRDSGRVTTVDQLGHSVQSYFTSQNSVFPVQGVAWITTLQTAGEIKSLPSNPASGGYTIGCYTANVAQNGICYQTNNVDAIVYMRSESSGNFVKAGCTAGQIVWVVWSSADGRSGLTCSAANTDPAIGVTGLK